MQEVAKRTKTLPIISLVLMEAIGCVRAKRLVGSSVRRNCAFGPKTLVSHRFSCSRYPNAPKHSRNIILGLKEVIGYVRAKKFIRSSEPRNSAFGHCFASIFVQEVVKRTKTLTIIILGLMEAIGCIRDKICRKVGSPKLCVRPRNARFTSFFI